MNKTSYLENKNVDSLSGVLSLGKEDASNIDQSTKLKMILRDIRENNLNEIYGLIRDKIDFLAINYNDSIGAIEIKIKKTSMKKISKFEHTTSFYYGIFGEIFDQFTMDHLDDIKNGKIQIFIFIVFCEKNSKM